MLAEELLIGADRCEESGLPQAAAVLRHGQWEWYGNAAHLIVAEWCRFHLATKVGRFLVSTVGEYLPDEGTRDVLARTRGITLEGRGDARHADYMRKIGYEEIGAGRKYETLVFRLGDPVAECECGCGLPRPEDWGEIDADGYNDPKAARAGHLAMCEKWSNPAAAENAAAAFEEGFNKTGD